MKHYSYTFFIKEEKVRQELVFAKKLETNTKDESKFNTMLKFVEDKFLFKIFYQRLLMVPQPLRVIYSTYEISGTKCPRCALHYL